MRRPPSCSDGWQRTENGRAKERCLMDRAQDQYEAESVEPGLSGARKAAVFLLTLDEPQAAAVLRRLPAHSVDDISREISVIGEVPPLVRWRVLRESLQVLNRGTDAPELARAAPFDFLDTLDAQGLTDLLRDEPVQVIGLVLANLPSARASEVLVRLPGQRQIEVVRHIAAMPTTIPGDIEQLEQSLRARMSLVSSAEPEEATLESEAAGMLFTFEDLAQLEDATIRDILARVDEETLAQSLKTATDGLKARVFANLSERAARLLRDDMKYMGPVSVSEVERAQRHVVGIVQRLERDGSLSLDGRRQVEPHASRYR